MIVYILLIVLTITSTIFAVKTFNRDSELAFALSLTCSMVSIVLFIASTIFLIDRNCSADDFKKKRDYCQEVISVLPEGVSIATANKIVNEATKINKTIEKNKKYCHSPMWAFMYNEGIAEVEPIDIPEFKVAVGRAE